MLLGLDASCTGLAASVFGCKRLIGIVQKSKFQLSGFAQITLGLRFNQAADGLSAFGLQITHRFFRNFNHEHGSDID